jgi:hypothetical protein
MNTGQAIDGKGSCSWIPGSRSSPAPRNDDWGRIGLQLLSPRRSGKNRRPFGAAAVILVMLGLALAGCGKKNAPQPPPGVPNTYPRPYPSV